VHNPSADQYWKPVLARVAGLISFHSLRQARRMREVTQKM
jgi:hypothetical protein